MIQPVPTIELEGLPATDRLDILRDHMLRSTVPLELRPSASQSLRVLSTMTDVGGVRILSVDGSGAAVHRTSKLARDDTDRRFILNLLERGSTSVAQSGRVAHLLPGDMAAISSAQEYMTTFERTTVRHGFLVPWEMLGLPDRLVQDQLARPVGSAHPLARVVSAYLLALALSAPDLDEERRAAAERPTLALVAALFAVRAGDARRARAALAETLAVRIEVYVRMHLRDRDLGVNSIARAHGISERYVYATVARSGISLGGWIRRQRLAAAAEELRSTTVTVAEVAHRWCFADHAHFSRAFKAEYGVTPSEWRAGDSAAPGMRLAR